VRSGRKGWERTGVDGGDGALDDDDRETVETGERVDDLLEG
jgi:hypothetical protein